MGDCPAWYDLIRAAKYLGCNPWDLLTVHPAWTRWSREAEGAEAYAAEERKRTAKFFNEAQAAMKGK